ncbi:MAG: UvrD-helicase domain-containing protein, partial [Clostridia bacterium]|nr:UvrD-helicase domain-containing protein [Clostridia bacterium]
MKDSPIVSVQEMERQQAFMQSVREMSDRPRRYHIVSMGCQMNERDSESVAGMLLAMGMRPEPVRERADLILYNTCCVRENAENKALGNVIWLKELKKDNPELMICVGGCMTQEKGMAAMMKAKYPFIDLIYGTHNLYKLPEYIYRVLTERRPVVEVMDIDGEVVEGMPEARRNRFNAFVNIMYGCDNFCTYCIVPYVRGRERSRKPEAVLEECRAELAAPSGKGRARDALEGARRRGEGAAELKTRVRAALDLYDRASIYTIHGFCNHVLTQYAFEAGHESDGELLQNTD